MKRSHEIPSSKGVLPPSTIQCQTRVDAHVCLCVRVHWPGGAKSRKSPALSSPPGPRENRLRLPGARKRPAPGRSARAPFSCALLRRRLVSCQQHRAQNNFMLPQDVFKHKLHRKEHSMGRIDDFRPEKVLSENCPVTIGAGINYTMEST